MSIGNEPAYPVKSASEWQAHGLSIRHYYAGLAMAACIAADSESVCTPEAIAKASVAYADALLAQLSKEPGHEGG